MHSMLDWWSICFANIFFFISVLFSLPGMLLIILNGEFMRQVISETTRPIFTRLLDL